MLVQDGEDRVVPPAHANYLHRECPRSELWLRDWCGDLRHVEAQGETKATSSSIKPSGPALLARTASAPKDDQTPARAAQSAGVKLSVSNSSDAA